MCSKQCYKSAGIVIMKNLSIAKVISMEKLEMIKSHKLLKSCKTKFLKVNFGFIIGSLLTAAASDL